MTHNDISLLMYFSWKINALTNKHALLSHLSFITSGRVLPEKIIIAHLSKEFCNSVKQTLLQYAGFRRRVNEICAPLGFYAA
jgi:hypothetical protein